MNILRKTVLLIIAAMASAAYAAAPQGYYDSCEKKSGQNLLRALKETIDGHTDKGYDGLWECYKKTDVHPDGKIWDMYSTKHWNAGEKCGNYKNIGDCYNREHSFPKSWFSKRSPMKSDLFHVYPTDGKVNGQRSNLPFGECANGTYVASSGSVRALGRKGTSTTAGYSGDVFEPDDEYKGDFARTYFYMAARYNAEIGSWSSPMLAGNSYPAYKSWAVDMLLKWHRQDPVSEKEIKRNDAVYSYQHNRNPFIDYPELAEHIWGNKKTEPWSASGSVLPDINQPISGSTADLGVAAAGIAAERTLTLRTTNARENVTLSISGSDAFSLSATSISAAAANAGTTIKIKVLSATAGKCSATLTVATGAVKSTVTLQAEIVDGFPVGKPTEITSDGFTANWTYIGDDSDGKYTIDVVLPGAGSIQGYPRKVDAKAEKYHVMGLNPSSDYTFTIASDSRKSAPVSVTTAAPVPMIEFLFDGDLYFSTTPGEPSEVAEILLDVDYIDQDITISVDAPFELSTDRSTWKRELTLSSDEDRFYLRLYSSSEGTFSSSLVATAGSYINDAAEVEGVVSSMASFVETFETSVKYDSYDHSAPVKGTACDWIFVNAGIWATDKGHESDKSVRMGKTSSSSLTMAADKQGGAGKVSFFAERWTASEGDATLNVQISTDGGQSWKTVGSVTVDNDGYKEYTIQANTPGRVRLRLQQTAGARFMIDDIAITDYTSGVSDPTAERHQWDSFSRNGQLVVNVAAERVEAAVYAIDGRTVFAGTLSAGEHTFPVAVGEIVIVHIGDFSRTVLIR